MLPLALPLDLPCGREDSKHQQALGLIGFQQKHIFCKGKHTCAHINKLLILSTNSLYPTSLHPAGETAKKRIMHELITAYVDGLTARMI